jgi:peptide/nickel transport system ATP-binding protein/oligopeptide transport system ATP-binding protein
LSAIPLPEPALERQRTLLRGDVPSPLEPPPGCHFHTRCPHATALCTQTSPPLVDDEAGHAVACHHWRQIVPATRPAAAATANARLLRLQSAFVQ